MGALNWLVGRLSKYAIAHEDVLGVDLGPSFVRICELEKSRSGSWVLKAIAYQRFKPSQDPSEQINQQAAALTELVKGRNISAKSVAVSLPLSGAIIRTVNLPLMSDRELRAAIETNSLWDNILNLPENSDAYSIYWQILKRDAPKQEMELLFVGTKNVSVEARVDLIERAGLNPIIVDLRCFAIRNAIVSVDSQSSAKHDGDFCLVSISEEESFVLIMSGQEPFTRNLYIPDDQVFLINKIDTKPEEVGPFVDALTIQLNQALSDFESRFGSVKFNTIFISIDGETKIDLSELFSAKFTRFSFLQYDPFRSISLPAHLSDTVETITQRGAFATAIGLATRKLDVLGFYKYTMAIDNVNLLPFRENLAQKRGADIKASLSYMLWSVVLFMAAAATWFFFEESVTDYNQLREKKAAIVREIQTINQEVEAVTLASDGLDGRIEAAQKISSNVGILFDVYDRTIRSIPDDMVLKKIEVSGEVIVVQGVSPSEDIITKYIENLSENELIRSAQIVNVKREENGLSDFKIRIRF